MTKLTVVVICSDRKSEVPVAGLRARDLPRAGVAARASLWRSRLRRTTGVRALTDLYRGEAWSVTPSVIAAARRAGFSPRLLVASAGLGLRRAESVAPGYAATFTTSQADSVGDDAAELRDWWCRLRAAPSALDPDVELRGRVLLVLSQAYAAAMQCDLVALGRRGGEVMLVGGAADIPGFTRVPADRGLRLALGGTATGLTMRMAHAWLSALDGPNLICPTRMQQWRTWADTVRHDESWSRQAQDDDQVLRFIRHARSVDPTLSRTRALRQLRDSDRACEQTRFAALYREAVAQP